MSGEKKNRKRHRRDAGRQPAAESKWRSPLLEPQTEAALNDSSNVTVPSSGWYGLFFGPQNQENSNGERASSVQDAGFRATFNLGGSLSTLKLPWEDLADERSQVRVPILDIRVGFCIYLIEGTEVSVGRRDSRVDEMLQAIRWQLFFVRGERPKHNIDISQATVISFPESNKPLVCSFCLRSFGSVKAVGSHVQATHSGPVDGLSIWNKPLDVVYQDENLAVIDKPQGMPVMGSKQSLMRSNLLLALTTPRTSLSNALRKPVPVHRLDSATGGLLVVAKTKESERKLKACFAEQKCRKQYHAVVFGKLDMPANHKERDRALLCDNPIQGKPATTFYSVLKHTRSADPMATDEWLTTLLLFPMTGRRHQLRRHLREVGHPIVGDRRYARYPKEEEYSEDDRNLDDTQIEVGILNEATNVESKPHSRLCLWAASITFPHPVSGDETSVALCSEPEWLGSLLRHQEALWTENHRVMYSSRLKGF